MIALLLSTALAAPHAHWAMEMEVSSTTKVPFFGATEVITRSVALVQIGEALEGQRGQAASVLSLGSTPSDTLMQTQKTCSVTVRDKSPGQVSFPDAFVAALPIQRYPVQFDGLAYTADPGPSALGYTPDGAPLPTEADDPRVIDHEQDGRPGATVKLKVPVFGTVYLSIVQFAHSRYRGKQLDSGEIRGSVEEVFLQQNTIAASVPGFAASPKTSPNPERSWFRMVPVEAGLDCAEAEALFNP